uniref:Uncharacterized protein n=1 Tax=Rhizophora mucronata TaxID=61149 RepID=A0A2P2Q222_RHIMU
MPPTRLHAYTTNPKNKGNQSIFHQKGMESSSGNSTVKQQIELRLHLPGNLTHHPTDGAMPSRS